MKFFSDVVSFNKKNIELKNYINQWPDRPGGVEDTLLLNDDEISHYRSVMELDGRLSSEGFVGSDKRPDK